MKEKLARGMLTVLIANVISMLFSVISNLFLPKYLSVDSYAYIKTFTLYISYAGFLHLGYEDGMYLKYGGKETQDLSWDELNKDYSTLRTFQLLVMIICFGVGFFFKDYVLMIFAFAIFPYNISMCFKNVYQATGEFKYYGLANNIQTISIFAFNMILLFLFRTDKYYYFLISYVFVYTAVMITMEYRLRKNDKSQLPLFQFSWDLFRSNIGTGFTLMLGTFSSILLTSMDRWFVKALLTTLAFAEYSFAVSFESFLNVVVSPVTVTMYNYFCKGISNEEVNKIKDYLLIFGSFLISCVYLVLFVIDIWIDKYEGAKSVMVILFSSQLLYMVIKGIYVNVYKAKKDQNIYFKRLLLVIIFGFISNGALFYILRTKEAFAIATLLSTIFWLFLCQHDYSEFRFKFREYVYIIISLTAFIGSALLLPAIVAFCLYLAVITLLNMTIMKKEFWGVYGILTSIVYSKIRIKQKAK